MMKAIGRPWKGVSRTDRPNFIGADNNNQSKLDKESDLIKDNATPCND